MCLLWLAASASAQSTAPPQTINGTVADASGSVVAGALVTLEAGAPEGKRSTATSRDGAFRFAGVEPGSYAIRAVAEGFAPWTSPRIAVSAGENPPLVAAVLRVAPASTKVDVGALSPHELAMEQLKSEEKQRLLGVFPHYFVNYDENAAPLTAAQKFQLGWKTIIDPVPILFSAIGAGIEQARNSYHEFGQGTEGYAKRFGAQYADEVNGVIIGTVLMHSVFHQDPRYFYKGTGSVRSRFLYAVATAFVCKGDNGHWQPDYSGVLGGLAAGEISTLYYPASSRTGLRLFHNVLLGFAGGMASNLFEEFLLRRITTHVPKSLMARMPVELREGTPVSLISVDDVGAKTTKDAGPVAFVLAADVDASGVAVVKAGSRAYGEATYPGVPASSEAVNIGLSAVHIKVGNVDIPLRSTQVRGAGGGLEYRRLEDSGKIALKLYVAKNVSLPRAQ